MWLTHNLQQIIIWSIIQKTIKNNTKNIIKKNKNMKINL
jgi:hypothetical protein